MLTGIIHVTGEHDTGKTTFALECGADPSRLWFVDDDIKGRATVKELRDDGVDFGRYDDLVKLSENRTELEFHQTCLNLIASIEPGQYDAIVWDTWTKFAKTCHPFVVANESRFRSNWSPRGDIHGSQQWAEARDYEARLLNRLQELAPTVVIVTHLKAHYLNKARTDKEVPACSKALIRVPVMRIWLRHNNQSPVPIGLVLKRPNQKRVTDKGLRTVNILPRKIVPRPEDKSLWDTIQAYYNEPVDLRPPTLDETPNEYELSILDGTLTEEQKFTLHLMLKSGAVDRDRPETVDVLPKQETQGARVRSLFRAGKTHREIMAETGLPLPVVLTCIASLVTE